MAFLVWEDSRYSVGVKTIDGQHHMLFGMINDLHEAMLKGQAQTQVGPLLRKLAQYTQTHFAEEEKMMSAANFPGLADHKFQHAQLIEKVQAFSSRYEKGEIAMNIDLMNFLRDWLTNHIQKVDREYSPWMIKQGVH
ncbi:MAG TPA: bacteriohemerythrin [Terracidiphilus sp.]|nr:bacteriohemerythrin [Terracidiphilus sp.]